MVVATWLPLVEATTIVNMVPLVHSTDCCQLNSQTAATGMFAEGGVPEKGHVDAEVSEVDAIDVPFA